MIIEQIDRVSGIDRETFQKEYLEPRRPVVFTDLSANWPAREKWTFDYLQDQYGDIEVPLYDERFSKPGKNYGTYVEKMRFKDYLELIRTQPTELRMFLFNIFKHAPELVEDIKTPDIMDGFIKEFPFMFFGGKGSVVHLHYDIDCSHVFLTQFQTQKRVVLFSPDQSKNLYHLPFTVTSLVRMNDLDETKYPAIKNLKGYECVLDHGETLFMPSCYWHHIDYIDGGFSIALRASDTIMQKVNGAVNIAGHFVIDRGMNKLLGTKWYDIKRDIAYKRAYAS